MRLRYTEGQGRKVVIRLLPPELDEKTWIASLPNPTAHDIRILHFLPGSFSVNKAQKKLNSHPLAYIQFQNRIYAQAFIKAYNGHRFLNERKELYQAVVALAPNQRVPEVRVKADGCDVRARQDVRAKERYLGQKYLFKERQKEPAEVQNTEKNTEKNGEKTENQPPARDGYFKVWDEKAFSQEKLYQYFLQQEEYELDPENNTMPKESAALAVGFVKKRGSNRRESIETIGL